MIEATEKFKVLAKKADEPDVPLRWLEIKSIEKGDKIMCASLETADLVTVQKVIPGPGVGSKRPVKVIGETNV